MKARKTRKTKQVALANANAAALYVRVSTASQSEDGVSLDAQLVRLRAYCVSQNLEVAGVYREEAVSGTIPIGERPEGAKLLQAIADGEVRHVVALKMDRLFRSSVDANIKANEWKDEGIAVHLVDMGGCSMSTGGAAGQMLFAIFAAFAEFERNLIAERTAAALAFKKKIDVAYASTPFGYDRDPDDEDKVLVENKHEATIITDMMAWRHEGMSLHKIADRLNTWYGPGKKGGRWHASTVKYIIENSKLAAEARDRLAILIS